ncbi:MAG: hypothetical protein AAF570_05335, partial [Bacteroidota bacterium]
MIRTPKRRIRDGKRFNHLIPPARGQTQIIRKNASLKHTLALIPKVVRENSRQMRRLAATLQGKTRHECAENIWHFCNDYIQYAPDAEGREQIRTPARTWHDRKTGVDCDCYSVFISCLLLEMQDPKTGQKGIPHTFRVTKYPDPHGLNPDPPFSHIYVILPDPSGPAGKELIIDPVYDYFNQEVPFQTKIDKPMILETLSGLHAAPDYLDAMAYHNPRQNASLFGTTPNFYNEYHDDRITTDMQDAMEAEALYGAKQSLKPKRPPTTQLPANSAKAQRIAREAAARGMTIPQYKQWRRAEFIRQHGITPEQYQARIRVQLDRNRNQANAQYQADILKLRRELDRRGVQYSRAMRKDQLLALLRANPAPKKAGQVINAINKANPATILFRIGLRIFAEKNIFGLSSKYWQFADLSPEQAAAHGLHPEKFRRLKTIWNRYRKIYYGSGGDLAKLKAAVAKGARRKAAKPESLNGLGQLGEISIAAAVAAAGTAMTALAALLKGLGDLKSEQPGQRDPELEKELAGKKAPDALDFAKNAVNKASDTIRSIKEKFVGAKESKETGTQAETQFDQQADTTESIETNTISKPKGDQK